MGLISRVSSRTYRKTNMTMDDIIAYGYSTLCVIGGAIGYAKSGSLPSIIAGSAIGLINAGGTYAGNTQGQYAQLGSSGLMAGVMGKKYFATGKLMPPGFFFGISTAYFGYNIFNNFINKKESKRQD